MLPLLAPLSALEKRLGVEVASLEGVEKARAEAALEDASALVRDEARRTFTDDAGQPDVPDAVRRIVLAVALRDYKNPEKVRSATDQMGPYQFTESKSDDEVTVYLTEAEEAIVQGYRLKSTGLWTLSTTRNDLGDQTGWMRDSYGTPIPVNWDVDRWWL